MNSTAWLFAFAATLLAVFALPLTPAIWEWRARRDATPLRVVADYNADIRHFALRFREFVGSHCRTELERHFMDENHYDGTLDDGKTRFQVAGKSGIPVLDENEAKSRVTSKLLLSGTPMTLPPKMAYDGEIYGTKTVTVEPYCRVRAALSEDSILLGAHSIVLRWIHSQNTLTAMHQCSLFGRASAEECITLGPNTKFERLHSRRIEFGRVFDSKAATPIQPIDYVVKNATQIATDYFLVEGDVDIPENSAVTGNLIVKGNLSIGANSSVTGNVKASGSMTVGPGAMIDGALVCELEMTLFPRCQVKGPVVSEKSLTVKSGTQIGTSESPTTLTAPRMRISNGVLAFGSIWAEEEGLVSDDD